MQSKKHQGLEVVDPGGEESGWARCPDGQLWVAGTQDTCGFLYKWGSEMFTYLYIYMCVCVCVYYYSSFPASFLDIVLLSAFLTSFSAYVTVSPGRRERGQSFARNSEDTLKDAARNTSLFLWTRYDNHPLEFAWNLIEGETHNLLTYPCGLSGNSTLLSHLDFN